jgi:hypothetical protein
LWRSLSLSRRPLTRGRRLQFANAITSGGSSPRSASATSGGSGETSTCHDVDSRGRPVFVGEFGERLAPAVRGLGRCRGGGSHPGTTRADEAAILESDAAACELIAKHDLEQAAIAAGPIDQLVN